MESSPLKKLLRLALPTSAMFLGLMAMGLVDMLFVGKLGTAQLGGMGLGNSIFSWVMTIGIGFLFGIDYPVSSAIGAKNRQEAFSIFIQGLYLAVALFIPACVLILLAAEVLDQFGLNPEVIPYAKTYLRITAISYLPVFLFNAAKSYLQAQSVAIPTLVILIGANLVNFFLNGALMEGKYGFPAYGYEGLAYSTVTGRFLMAAAILAVVFYREIQLRSIDWNQSWRRFRGDVFKTLARLGAPASAQMLLEVGVFSLSTALAAKFASVELAAHQVVLNTASLLFMVPLGVGSAAGSLVGQAMGARNPALARKTGYLALGLGLVYAVVASAGLIFFADSALAFYTQDPAVVAAAKGILLVAAPFQIADGAQVIATGTLRGLGDTISAAWTNGIGHWLIGLPLGLFLGFQLEKGILGIWIGLALGLLFVAAVPVWVWKTKTSDLRPS